MKHWLLLIFLSCSGTVAAQFPWYGYDLYDWLVEANHPQGCNPDYVTFLPDDSTWVNMLDFSVMTGYFGQTWNDQPGDDLLLETSFHRDNYSVRLILAGGEFSGALPVDVSDWTQIDNVSWKHMFPGCVPGTAVFEHFMFAMDFASFGVLVDDDILGIEITFLPTPGLPDFAGAYIIVPPCGMFSLGPDTTLCPGETIDIDATTPGASYEWQDGYTGPVYANAGPGKFWVEVTLDNCSIVDTINVHESAIPLELGNDLQLCAGETTLLNATIPGATYQWQDNSSQPTYTVTAPGTYWVHVELDECTYGDTVDVDYTDPLLLEIGNDTLLCDGDNLVLDASLPGATYEWQDNSTLPTYFVSDPGEYAVTLTVDGCTAADVIEVDYFYLDPVDLGDDVQLCEGETLFLDAFFPGATYEWQDNSTSSSYNVDEPGMYWVIVSLDVCTTSDTIEVEYGAGFVVDLGSDIFLCSGENITLDATTPGATYAWQDNSNSPTYNVTGPGEYSVVVKLGNCTASDTVVVDFGDNINLDIGNDTMLCQQQSLLLHATTPNATYLWQDNSTDSTFTVSGPGTYAVQVQVGNCITRDTILVSYTNGLEVELGNDTTLCQGETITLDAITPNGAYVWQDNSTDTTFVANQPGRYSVNVTVGSCSASDTIDIAYLTLSAVLGNDTTLCKGETIVLDAQNPGASYIWQDNSTASTLVVDQAGNYWVNISLNNCQASDSIFIQYDPLGAIVLGNDTSLCEGSTLLLNANAPGAAITWQDNSTGNSFQVTSPGTYWATAVSAHCSTADTIDVNFVSLSSIQLGNDTTLCVGETLVLDGNSPGLTYLWQDNSTAPTYFVTQPGVYWLQVSADNCSIADTIEVNYVTLFIELGNDTTLCFGETIHLDANQPGATYHWQDNSTNAAVTVTQPGNYAVTVTLGNCEVNDMINVTYNSLVPVDLGNDTTLCEDETLLLEATSPGASYLWQDGTDESVFLASTTGVYSIVVRLDQCAFTDSIVVSYLALSSIDLGNDTTLCWGDAITLFANAPGAQYQWSDNSTSQQIVVSQPGFYWVQVSLTDCVASDSIDVAFSDPVFIDLGPDVALCVGDTLLLDVETVGATYAWHDHSAGSTFVVVQSGTYWVEVDVDGCAASDTIDISYTILPGMLLGNDTTLCEGDELVLEVSFAGAGYVWQDNSTAPTFIVDQPGQYAVTLNVQDCQTADTLQVQYASTPVLDLGGDKSICAGESVLLDGDITLPVEYLWQDNSTSKTFLATEPGLYWLQVTDACGVRADTIAIAVENCICHIYVPNVFTPGNNGINDQVFPYSNCAVTSFVFRIYDRFGGLLFETNTWGEGWDGTVNGDIAQVSVYAFQVLYQFEDGKRKSMYGDITVLR